jgi:uncharacterized membrane protein YebE (DUF533 family)
MFNPEKLLGGLLKGSLGGSGGMGTKAAVGMGLLGVAMEAVEHFMDKSKTGSQAARPPGAPTGPPGSPPPMGAGPSAPPPPPPGKNIPPPGPPGPAPAAHAASDQAILLIRAMIAAANADGFIDAEERQRIMQRLESVGLSPEETGFIKRELSAPGTLDSIASQVTSHELAKQAYAVSVLAITVDTQAEREYLDGLARRLGLVEADVTAIMNQLNR